MSEEGKRRDGDRLHAHDGDRLHAHDGDGNGVGEVVEYDKLVRDDIPEIIRENDEEPETHVADDVEYARRLREKLVEEATEFAESGEVEELADVLTVVDAVCLHENIERDEVERRADEKASERGGFAERIVLERVRK